MSFLDQHSKVEKGETLRHLRSGDSAIFDEDLAPMVLVLQVLKQGRQILNWWSKMVLSTTPLVHLCRIILFGFKMIITPILIYCTR